MDPADSAVRRKDLPTADTSNLSPPADQPFVIRTIIITGNKKTRNNIILREIPFKVGDHFELQQLVKRFEQARQQLMNTALFHDVVVALKSFQGYDVDILVDVKERWYLFPIPYFKLIDRNFNQWWVEQNRSLDRVNYGLKILHNNTTGRNDKLNVWLVNGYTKQVSMSYDRLYFDKRMKWGFKTGFAVGKNREVNYATVGNKQVFLKDDKQFIRSFFNANAELTYRKAIRTRHRFGIAYTDERVGDTVTALNPSFFLGGNTHVRYPEFYYNMQYLGFDYNPYPLRGFGAEINVSKKGLHKDFNLWQLTVKGAGNWTIKRNLQFHLTAVGSLKLPFKQSFYNKKLLGYYDMNLQGYEYYVVDGVLGGYLKAAVTKQLVKFNINFPTLKYSKPVKVPVRIFAKMYGNAGYVHDPEPQSNYLADRMLYSGGFGIDIVTFYDFVLKLEWSFNQLGQNGLYLHKKSIF